MIYCCPKFWTLHCVQFCTVHANCIQRRFTSSYAIIFYATEYAEYFNIIIVLWSCW